MKLDLIVLFVLSRVLANISFTMDSNPNAPAVNDTKVEKPASEIPKASSTIPSSLSSVTSNATTIASSTLATLTPRAMRTLTSFVTVARSGSACSMATSVAKIVMTQNGQATTSLQTKTFRYFNRVAKSTAVPAAADVTETNAGITLRAPSKEIPVKSITEIPATTPAETAASMTEAEVATKTPPIAIRETVTVTETQVPTDCKPTKSYIVSCHTRTFVAQYTELHDPSFVDVTAIEATETTKDANMTEANAVTDGEPKPTENAKPTEDAQPIESAKSIEATKSADESRSPTATAQNVRTVYINSACAAK